MKVFAKRTFLLKQETLDGGIVKDIVARKGEAIDVTEQDYKKFKNDFSKVPVPANQFKKK